MRALLAIPLLVLGGGADSQTAAQSRRAWPAPEVLARQFERIAFSSEFGGEYRAGRLIRWQGPLRVRINGHYPDRFRAEVERQLNELRQLSGLDIEIVGSTSEGASPPMTIEFSSSRGGTSFDPEAPCRTLIWETGYVIRRVQIYIAPYPDEVRRHCIAEELTQALGLADDFRASCATASSTTAARASASRPGTRSWCASSTTRASAPACTRRKPCRSSAASSPST